MSTAAATALETALRAKHTLPHAATIETAYREGTQSLAVWAEISDELNVTQENEIATALNDIIPETFEHNRKIWDVDSEGLLA